MDNPVLPSRLVITQIYGGQGNQMFQYAAGLGLAKREGAELWLDLGLFQHYPLRQYLLNHYRVHGLPATKAMLAAAGERSWYGWKGRILRHLRPLLPARPVPELVEGEHRYRLLELPKSGRIHLKGYWQSEKYFAGIAQVLRREFVPRQEAGTLNAAFLRKIRKAGKRAVSVHVRRGDYASNAVTLAHHGLCGLDYYHEALKRVRRRIPRPAFFAFSDDPVWTRENLRLGPGACYVSHNPPDKPWEDLRLMAGCAHFVIANSTFSWWGAWLSPNKAKLVIAPKKWFAASGLDPVDLIPNSWSKI